MISVVACCRGAKLCAHAARDFRSQRKWSWSMGQMIKMSQRKKQDKGCHQNQRKQAQEVTEFIHHTTTAAWAHPTRDKEVVYSRLTNSLFVDRCKHYVQK